MNKKKIILVIFLYFLTLNSSFSIEADVFVQSTVNRASKILSEDLSKDEKIEVEKGVTEIYEEVSIQSDASSEKSNDILSEDEIEKSDKNIDENSAIEKESKSIKTSNHRIEEVGGRGGSL